MDTLTGWKFDTAGGAEPAERTLMELAKQELIKIHDAATVTWEEGRKKPKTRQAANMVAAGALGGFLLGLAVRSHLLRATAGQHAELIQTNLSDADEAKLREAFGEE